MKQDVQHPAGPSNTAGGSEGRAKRRPKKKRNRFHVVMALFLAIVAVSIALVVVIVANLNFDRKGAGAAARHRRRVRSQINIGRRGHPLFTRGHYGNQRHLCRTKRVFGEQTAGG